MGTHPAPPYADNFMAKRMDTQIEQIGEEEEGITITFLKRFLDDILAIIEGSSKQLHILFEK